MIKDKAGVLKIKKIYESSTEFLSTILNFASLAC